MQANLESRWDAALAEIETMKYQTTLTAVCVAILRTDWDRTDPQGLLNKTPAEVENFLRSFSIRNFAFDEHSIGVRKALCHIIDAFQYAAQKRQRMAA